MTQEHNNSIEDNSLLKLKRSLVQIYNKLKQQLDNSYKYSVYEIRYMNSNEQYKYYTLYHKYEEYILELEDKLNKLNDIFEFLIDDTHYHKSKIRALNIDSIPVSTNNKKQEELRKQQIKEYNIHKSQIYKNIEQIKLITESINTIYNTILNYKEAGFNYLQKLIDTMNKIYRTLLYKDSGDDTLSITEIQAQLEQLIQQLNSSSQQLPPDQNNTTDNNTNNINELFGLDDKYRL